MQRILVVTEGTKTEQQYVELLDSYLRSKESTAIVKPVGVGRDPLCVVRKCVELRDAAAGSEKAYDVCVCLVDVDQHTTLTGAIELAEREAVLLLISNLKFETWLRWHAEDKRSALTSVQLDRQVVKLGLTKAKTKDLAPGFPIGDVDRACRTARQADPALKAGRKGPDPSSAMPVPVDLVRGTGPRGRDRRGP